MNRFYTTNSYDGKTTCKTWAASKLFQSWLTRSIVSLLMFLSVFSYAQADVTIQGVNYTEIDGKITVDGTEYEVWQGDYDQPANGTRTPSQLQLGNYFSGSGTQADPYIIDSAKKFATLGYLSAYVFTGSNYYGYFKLTKNICLAKYQWGFGQARSQSFQATLDGDGHTIIGLFLYAVSSDTAGGGQYRYGLFSCTKGASDANRAVVKNLTVSKPTLYVEGAHDSGDHYFGIVAGRVQEWSTIENVKVVDPLIDVRVSQKSNWYMSTGIAYCAQNNGMRVNNIVVKNPKVKSYGSLTYRTANSNVRFFFGGAVSYIYSNSNDAARVSIANNCTVTGADIDFRAFAPEVVGNYARNLFMVGGVIGVSADPHKYPENLYFSGKIFAPFAVVAPCLVSSKDNDPKFDAVINYYSGEVEGNTDEVERSASSSWHYGEYKIGVYGDLASPTQEGGTDNYYIGSGTTKRYVNYKASDVETIEGTNYIDANKLVRHNRYKGTPRRSSTVIWWTENNNGNTDNKESTRPTSLSDWREGEQYLFPEYQKNLTAFPWYYLYYAQGVNRDTKSLSTDGGASSVAAKYETAAEKNVENAMGKSGAKNITLTLTDSDKGKRGFDAHSFSVAATGDDAGEISSYQWYVDGVAQGTGTSISVKPGFNKTQGYQNGTSVIVQALDGSDNILAQAVSYLPVPRLRFKGSDTAGTKTDGVHEYVYDAGTKEHPYLLGCEDDLRLLSEQMKQPSNLRQEYIHFSSGLNSGNKCYYRSQTQNIASNNPIGYGQAYYELDSNIDFSADSDDSPFEPIGPNGTVPFSADGTYGNYNNNFAFVGSVDGKGFTISNLRETWYAGYANGGAVSAWGLFSCIGSTGQYYKVGETTATKAAVRNLIIDGAVFTHDTANRSFYYPGTNASATSGNSNNCFIGPLAGIAGNYSIIENISVTNTRITDEGSSEYKLAAKRLSIGGVIGRATAAISDDNKTLDNATLRYLSSDADIDIQNAEFTNLTNATQTQLFNIGGIVGSIHSNAAANTVPYPVPSVYTGKVRARNAIVGPTFGYVSWSGNTNTGYLDFARHFTAKTSASATFDATGMFYSGFQIYDGTQYKDITDTYPSVTSDWGDRNIKGVSTHANSNVYTESPKDLYEYQGVNQGNYEIVNSPAVTEAFSYDALATEEKAALEDYTWGWSAGKFTIGATGLSVYAKDTYDGNTVTEHVLSGTITTASTDPKSYQWYERKRIAGDNRDVAIDGATSSTYTAEQSIHNRYIYLQGTVGESSESSAVIIVPKSESITASITKTAGSVVDGKPAAPWTLTANLSTTGATPLDAAALAAKDFVITYQWYKGQEGSGTPIDGATSNTLEVAAGDDETTLRYCEITVVDGSVWWDDYKAANTYKFTLTKLPANVKVVYLDPAGSGNDSNNGLTPETAVKSWHKAYSLLTPDVTWDDNIIVLMSESNGDRTIEGFRLDKSLEAQYTEGSYEAWYNRTYYGTEAYWPGDVVPAGYATGIQNSVLWKNATITGKWDNHDYTSSAKITFKSDRAFIGLNADTKFENLTFRGHAYGSVGGSSYDIFFCQYNSVEFGDGLRMEYVYADGQYGHMAGSNTPDFEVFGGFNGDARFRHDTNGFLGNEWDKYFPNGKEGFTMTFKSGHFGVICASHRQAYWTAQGMSGTPNMPVKCKIVVDMDRTWNDKAANKACIGTSNGTNADYDIGLILAGNHEGAMYGDVDINVYSGHVARIANGTLGAYRKWYGYAGICQPGNAYFGRANTLLDPSLSRFVKPEDTRAVKNERIIVTEIYGGGLGRDLGDNGMIFIPFYGKSSVTMNGGTFRLLPEGNTHDTEGEVFPGIFATGAGGVNGMYHFDDPIEISGSSSEPQVHPSSQRLPYWDTDKGNGVVWGGDGSTGGLVRYGNWSTYKDKTGDYKVYVHCYNADTDDFTDLDPEDSQATVTINDGVFGTSTKKIDGIYGGGSGYTPTYILKNSTNSYPNYRSGNIYGKEGVDHPVAKLTINGGEFYCTNGVFAGGRGTDHYYKTVRNNSGSSEEGAWYGNYTGLGQIYGDVELNITGGTFHCPVYGGGLGFGDVMYNSQAATKKTLKDMARIYGTTTMNISGGTFEGNIYGGGAIANVGYGTSSRESKHYSIGTKNAVTMNITGGRIAGKVFGAAMGKTNVEVTEAPDSIGNVFGNVNLVITGDSIGSDIYGGAEKGDVYGNVTANISNVAIGGDIYGGGMGVYESSTIKASADVRGSTNVTLGTGAYYIKEVGGDNHFERDSLTAHYIYGGGNIASIIGTYDSTVGASVTSVTSGGNTTVNINNGMGTEQLTVYGAGYGANTYCNMTNVNINNFATTRGEYTGKYKNVGLREVYGGGNEGTVFTSTNVGMKGGQVFGTVFGGGNLAPVGTLAGGALTPFGTMVSLASENAIIWGDIFGGGNQANVKGTAQVSVSQGRFAGQVFGGGKGVMTNANTVGTPANIIGQTKVFVNGANVQWNKLWVSLFGEAGDASEKGTFKEWTGAVSGTNRDWFITPTIEDGKKVTTATWNNPHNIFGGGYLACVVTDTAKVEVTNGAVPSELIKKKIWKLTFTDNNNPHFYVFGGGYGPFTQVKATDVIVGVEGYYNSDVDESTSEQWSLDVPFADDKEVTAVADDASMGIYGNNYGIGGYTVLGVIGGGYAGLVKEDTNVKLGGTTFVHRVYGGGYGHLGEWKKLAVGTNIATGISGNIITDNKTRDNLGEVGRNTNVYVSLSKPDESGRTGGVYGDVFGGGAGVESATLDAGSVNYTAGLTDFPHMGEVKGFTRTKIAEYAKVYGSVYGGGDVASVVNSVSQARTDSATIVRVVAGDVFGDVFGGGKGRTDAVDYTLLGNIEGNTFVFADTLKIQEADSEEPTEMVPNIWGNIYGGGQMGDIKANATQSSPGHTYILVNGGNIGNNIYGAGEGVLNPAGTSVLASADVAGNTNIIVNGGSFLWRKIAADGGSVRTMTDNGVTKEAAETIIAAKNEGTVAPELTALKNDVSDVFDIDNYLFVNDHNIYGGGNTASIVGGYRDKDNVAHNTAGEHSATITVNHGMMTDDLGYYDDEEWSTGALLHQLIKDNNSHPQFSVLGGGYGINTTITGNTTVNVSIGKSAAYEGATDDGATQTADRASWDALMNTSTGQYKTEFNELTTEVKNRYYGGTSGGNALNRYIASRLANCFSIPNHTFMNIIGGGMAGLVNGNATVSISDQTHCHNVFGGGIGILPESPTGTETYGQVGGTTAVSITGGVIEENVYGGGAGVESVDTNDDGTPDFDFTQIAAVDKTTTISIDGTPSGTIVFGKVFGGGDVANIKNSASAATATSVTILGGCVYQQIFGGGSGRLKSECVTYTTVGKVTGNTSVTINVGEVSAPWLWNRVYGGGSYGSVTGNTTVNIQGGHIGYNVFGGGFGSVDTLSVDNVSITSSDVGGNTNVNITGGEWCLSQMWDVANRNWMPADLKSAGVYYTSQYDPVRNKFRINHNIYGGGNAASSVAGISNVNMTKGMIYSNTPIGRDGVTNIFEEDEWKNIYNKVGSFHFSVIGGGYGKNTSVDSTNVHINMAATTKTLENIDSSTGNNDEVREDLHLAFQSQQSVLDVIGGGYNGVVNNGTNVVIEGDPYLRRAFGGSFYNDVKNTRMLIKSANVDDVFAGGMMGDVTSAYSASYPGARVQIGETGSVNNSRIFINHDVYGGNDVSGQINGLIRVDIRGGKIFHNVYGAGNGNYLYALNEERTVVTGVEDYEVDGGIYPLVYEVPRRKSLMEASAELASEATRLVNINSYRPLAQYVSLSLAGSAADNAVKVVGSIFGGGNTATLTKLDGNAPKDTVNIGSYVTASQVFMGADGEAMFDESSTGFLNAFKRINNIELSDAINWSGDPYNKSIPETYLPLSLDDRQKTFPHIIDLYFQPVQMPIQPELYWAGTKADPTVAWGGSIAGTTIGSFFCGGNRGNMDVTPKSDGSVVSYLFPHGITIKDKIVGGCNNANFVRKDLNVVHEGGYLLGVGGTMNMKNLKPLIYFKVETNGLKPYLDASDSNNTYTGGNIYGGCFKSGTVNGDIKIDVQSNIMHGLDVDKVAATNKASKEAGNIYGGGYGSDSYVNGDIQVAFGTSATTCTQSTSDTEPDALPASLSANFEGEAMQGNKVTDAVTYITDAGFSANNIYGGGDLGKVKGNTIVKILNGHITGSVSGGAYAGVQYGSTHVFVGYPDYYQANASGEYNMIRADKKADNLDLEDYGGEKTIKRVIKVVKGDFIAPTVYDAIDAYDTENGTSQTDNFTLKTTNTPADWTKVSIKIDGAVYGGGYSLANTYTGSGGAGDYTVKKYTDEENIKDALADEAFSSDPLYNGTGAGYCGHTTVLVWDNKVADNNADHITIAADESADGGMFGDGHLSYSEGLRAGELRGYGYAQNTVSKPGAAKDTNNAKILNSIQRFDLLRLTDNCLLLNGARDYTIREVSTTPYSLSRIGELQMVSNITTENTNLQRDSTVVKYRNYLGLLNNIHYVGAIKSSEEFTHDYHDAWGRVTADKSYKVVKKKYIDDWYGVLTSLGKTKDLTTVEFNSLTEEQKATYNTAKNTFNRRNDATSANMIGLSSGYALKVQGTQVTDPVGTEKIYYGPIDGVIEMKLIQPILDEGGGYVYADNIHDEPETFLETSGNFVFPAGLGSGQYVVDDCLLTSYDALHAAEPPKTTADSEMHYWFLTGRHYYYNLHITGYTYDSSGSGKEIKFDADTSDGLTILEGANANSLVISGVKWKHHHNADGTDDTTYNGNCDIEDNTKAYTLRLSASNAEEAGKTITVYNETELKSLFSDIDRHQNFNVRADTITHPRQAEYTAKTMKMTKDGVAVANGTGSVNPTLKNPLLAIQLVDNVNNSESAEDGYWEKYLSKPDTVQIELRSNPEAWNTYTINLIINYVKGPSHTGNISVVNCALPGEYIKLDKTTLHIDADESFAQNGEFWRIGKRSDATTLANGYYTFDVSGEKTSEVLKNKVYVDSEGRYIMIPAYYFMNGYGVQYVYTCNNMNEVEFPVAMREQDTLTVHNYHQMSPDATFAVEQRLPEAVARATKEASFPQPRIYMRSANDLLAFQQFVDTVGTVQKKIALPGYMQEAPNDEKYDSVTVARYGENLQFYLQNDITIQQTSSMADHYYTAPAQFKGTLNGDGYIINGIDNNLVGTLAEGANIYNLGLTTGSIAGTKTGTIHTSYEYGNLKVYDMAGAEKSYTAEEFNNGTVAYNLNQYYLEARKKMLETPATTQSELADAVTYVRDYYKNGDYQYARQYNAATGKEYLRTNINPNYAVNVSSGYDTYESYHNTAHPVDTMRAVAKATQGNYRPLFNAVKIDPAVTIAADSIRNDYIFFGQDLQATPEEHPTAIDSKLVKDQGNRVWRASGFYRTKVDRGYHFNANTNGTHAAETYVNDVRTTAIDFTGKRDAENSGSIPNAGMLDLATQKVFYAPSLDLPTEYQALRIGDDVTQNLLVYTGAVDGEAPQSISYLVNDVYRYTDDTDESDISLHHITGTPATSYTAARLHLVDKEDFNAPIAFTATKAWYERDPQAETGYVEQSGKAWSSIALPYMVQTATLSDGITRYQDAFGNGSNTGNQTAITFFYGSDGDATASPTTTVLNHEFWLRGMTAVNTVSGQKRATFKRPETAINTATGFAAYKPFIVSFPGEQFYEFNMTGQTITFGAADATIDVTDDATTYDEHDSYKHYSAFLNNDGDGVYAINVDGVASDRTGDKFESGKHVYPFRSYLTTGSALSPNSMNAELTSYPSPLTSEDYVLIADDIVKREKVLDGDISNDPDGGVTTESGLRVYALGKRIIVVSDYATTLPVHTISGALVRVLDVLPGTSTYSGFQQGVYVVDKKKIRLR